MAWRVPSLELPTESAASTEQLSLNPAVQLFVQRATAAQPRFALIDRNASAVVQICRRLDGIPLAMELAAARVEALTADQIALRLDQRFRLLTGGTRAALPRQQTLAATLDWSHDLLSGPERRLVERLAVFSGSWTLEAAEAVCADGRALTSEAVLDLLGPPHAQIRWSSPRNRPMAPCATRCSRRCATTHARSWQGAAPRKSRRFATVMLSFMPRGSSSCCRIS